MVNTSKTSANFCHLPSQLVIPDSSRLKIIKRLSSQTLSSSNMSCEHKKKTTKSLRLTHKSTSITKAPSATSSWLVRNNLMLQTLQPSTNSKNLRCPKPWRCWIKPSPSGMSPRVNVSWEEISYNSKCQAMSRFSHFTTLSTWEILLKTNLKKKQSDFKSSLRKWVRLKSQSKQEFGWESRSQEASTLKHWWTKNTRRPRNWTGISNVCRYLRT